MTQDHEHIWDRTLPEPHHFALCKHLHLAKFLDAAKRRKEQYFATVSLGSATLERVLHRKPSEQDILAWTALVLGKDRSFMSYVSDHGGAVHALEPEKWRRVIEAGAGAIVAEYLIACETAQEAE